MRFCIMLGALMICMSINPEQKMSYRVAIPVIITMVFGGFADAIEFFKSLK